MICKVRAAIERFSMLGGRTVAVGLSGGADSVALLHILYGLRGEYGYTLCAAHVNHELRGEEADRDESFVRRLCESMDIPLKVLREDVASLSRQNGMGLEECGRQVRYGFFESLGADRIATAHTLSDSLETMLMNLSRGCSLSGLCGIPPVRGKIIRPLIMCTSDEVRQYCKDNGLSYVVDSTNLTDEYSRNRVRHVIIPELERLNPSFEQNALRCTESLRDDEMLLSDMAAELTEKARLPEGFDAGLMAGSPLPVLRRSLYSVLYERSGAMPERKHLDALCGILKSGGKTQLCGGLLCEVSNGVLSFPAEQDDAREWCMPAEYGANVTPYSEISLSRIEREAYERLTARQKGCLCFDRDKISGGLTLRSRREGDRLADSHRQNTKTLKKLYNEKKIPVQSRNSYAVLSDEAGVVWVEGFCTDSRCDVDSNTENIVYIKTERKSI